MSSVIITCTANRPISRGIAYFTIGHGHQALVKNLGQTDEYWIDSRGCGGVQVRPPERDLHAGRYLLLPWDIENGVRSFLGRPFNFRGPFARALHLRWYDPHGFYCDQLLLAGSRVSGYPVCHEGDEDKVDPITTERLFCAAIFALGLTPIQWDIGDLPPGVLSYGGSR